MVIPIILMVVLIIWVYRVGRFTGRQETKRKIHRVLQVRDPLYSLGKLNQQIEEWEAEHEPTKWYRKRWKF